MQVTTNVLARRRLRFWAHASLFQLVIALLAGGTLFRASWAATRVQPTRVLAAPVPRAFLPSIKGLPLAPIVDHDWQFAARQIDATTRTIPTTSYPTTTNSQGQWNTTSAAGWPSGFFPGSLWFMYEHTSDSTWRGKAEAWQAGIESQKLTTTTHDLGFMIFNSFGNGHHLTGEEAYRQVILTAAGSLATRYSSVVGCIRSLDGRPDEFRVIIDNMMNLELLFWASKHGGQTEWYNMAVNHALKTRQEQVRADGSTYHQVVYDPATGAVLRKGTVQGYRDDSTWARGQAWAIYGFTMTYRETGDSRFLDTARKTADYFLSHLPPDNVPYWDFQAPNIPNEPRDSSAAAIAASGLLELSQLESDTTRKQNYLSGAVAILATLSTPAYLAEGTTNSAILLHGTYNKPGGDYDTGLIWGDYYFLEALLRAQPLIR